ncbi:MAG: hypothetical protein KAI47_02895 [Deltaproteobacteria bacterium]|nr:hypothetical protein [Deltaproteobacteria bacterium]
MSLTTSTRLQFRVAPLYRSMQRWRRRGGGRVRWGRDVLLATLAVDEFRYNKAGTTVTAMKRLT